MCKNKQSSQVAQHLAAGSAAGTADDRAFERQGQPWVELEHRDVQAVIPGGPVQHGRLGADGHWLLSALKVPPNQVAVVGQAPAATKDSPPSQTLMAAFKLPVWQVVELAGDAQGRIWLVVDLVQLDAKDMPVQRMRQAVILMRKALKWRATTCAALMEHRNNSVRPNWAAAGICTACACKQTACISKRCRREIPPFHVGLALASGGLGQPQPHDPRRNHHHRQDRARLQLLVGRRRLAARCLGQRQMHANRRQRLPKLHAFRRLWCRLFWLCRQSLANRQTDAVAAELPSVFHRIV